MAIIQITYSRLHNLGNYENERFEVTVTVEEGDVAAAFTEARITTDQAHTQMEAVRAEQFQRQQEEYRLEQERRTQERQRQRQQEEQAARMQRAQAAQDRSLEQQRDGEEWL